jgi:osmotically-inducible protein OsmY
MSPEELVAAVNAALERNPDINLHRYPVRIEWDDERDALFLAGVVEDIAALRKIQLTARRLAEVLAWWTPGASRVRNRIQVEPPEEETDDELIDAIRIVLEKEPSLDASQVRVEARDGIVTLEGAVPAEASRAIAGLDCWYVPGVHAVDNRIRVVR